MTIVSLDISAVRVRLAHVRDRTTIMQFYARTDYSPTLGANDVVLIAEYDAVIIGALRLALEQNHLVLRGMRVDEQFQRQGIGSFLLLATPSEIGARDCYCLPFSHLTRFYSKVGFRLTPEETLPAFLRARAERYRAKGEKISPMLRTFRSADL